MRFTVVICTYNRAESLRQTLIALRHQTYTNFEVVVVNGPSTDNTEQVIAEFAGTVRSYRCPKPRLSMSRNIGIANSTGDIVAFLDDDALPECTWLDELSHTYLADPTVGAVGGIVYDHTGTRLQYRYAVCSRDARPRFDVEPPLNKYTRPHADPFLYLQGTNMSYSRKLLREMGGFDENILHYFDDVETCMQVIDRGYRVVSLPRAGVHHKFLASHIRNHNRILLDPYNLMTDRCYFALRHGRGTRSTREIVETLTSEADRLRTEAEWHYHDGRITEEQYTHFQARLDEALSTGMKKGLGERRIEREIPPIDSSSFLPYPTCRTAGKRLRVCFVTREYPPGDFGGPARCTAELATGFAQAGHDTHVITRSPDHYRVDFEAGVWVHRIPAPDRWVPELDGVEGLPHLAQVAAVYREVTKLHEQNPIDLVLAPLWLCEGLVCGFDPRFPTVTTLVTAMKAVSTLAEWAQQSPEAQQLVVMEEETIARGQHFHAVSSAILERSVTDYKLERRNTFIAPLAISDHHVKYPRRRTDDGRIRILYVGRLEPRKGAEVMIEAAVKLCREFPNVEVVLAGKDTIPTDQGDTLHERFETNYGADRDLTSRIQFTGLVSEDDLYQHYADADIFCLPTFYESFGLVYVEAMTFSLPLVGSRVGGVPEVVNDGEHGYLLPPGDIEGITDALRKLIVNPELRAEFGRISRQRYEERFAPAVVVRRLEPEFARIVAKHQANGVNRHAAAPKERIADQFAEVIALATGRPIEHARRASNRLLDPRAFPVDYVKKVLQFVDVPTEDFISNCYQLFLTRDARKQEVDAWAEQLHRGTTRLRFVQELVNAGSLYLDLPRGCVDGLRAGMLDPAPTTPVPAVETTVVPPPVAVPKIRKVRHHLSALPIVGKLFKYIRRVILLPWNFHKFHQAFGTGEQVLGAMNERQTVVENTLQQQVLPLLRELAAQHELLRESLRRLQSAVSSEHQDVKQLLEDRTPIRTPAVRLNGPHMVNGEHPVDAARLSDLRASA